MKKSFMLIGLFTLLIILLSGGKETFMLNPELKKNVSTYVEDKSRKKEIDSVIKYVEKEEDKFQKVVKKDYDKKLENLNLNLSSTKQQFNQEYDNFYKDLGTLQNEYIAGELKIRTLLNANEWDKIMDKVLKQPEKEKVRKKLLEENKKIHDKLIADCNKHIADQSGRAKAKSFVDNFATKGASLDSAYLELNYQNFQAIRPYQATRQDFEPIRKRMLALRRNYTDGLVNMRFELLAITPEKEWNGLAKDLKQDFENLGVGISKQ